MERFGTELIFISRISGDGKRIEDISVSNYEQKDIFKLTCLSISNGTYIASSMSTYIVKLKNPPNSK